MQKSLILLFFMLINVEVMAFGDEDSEERSSNSSPILPLRFPFPDTNKNDEKDQKKASIQNIKALKIDADFIRRYGQGLLCDEATVDQSFRLPLLNLIDDFLIQSRTENGNDTQ